MWPMGLLLHADFAQCNEDNTEITHISPIGTSDLHAKWHTKVKIRVLSNHDYRTKFVLPKITV